MNRLELYAIALAILAIAYAGAYFKGRHDGYESAEDKAAVVLTRANEKTDATQEQLLAATRDDAAKIEQERTRHDQELAAVRSDLTNRLCRRVPEGEVRMAGGTSSAAQSSVGSGPIPGPAQGTDAWRDAFISACQHDHDRFEGWQRWWAQQQAIKKEAG